MNVVKHVFVVVCLLLSACEEQKLYSDLDEHAANKMVALLDMAELPVQKVAEKGHRYAVMTSKDAVGAAIKLLEANGLPERNYDTFEDLFSDDVLIPSPLAEQAKLNRMLSQAMSSTLSNIDGVVLARVHLTIPKQHPGLKKTAASSASVFIKHRSEVNLESSMAKIKALVVDAFENLQYDDVTVMFFPEKPLFVPESLQPSPITPKSPMQLVKMQVLNMPAIIGIGLMMLVGALGWCLWSGLFSKKLSGQGRAPSVRSSR